MKSMVIKNVLSQNIFAILLSVGLFLSPCVCGGFLTWLEDYPNPIEVTHGNNSDIYEVVQQFGTSLIRNDFNSAKEVLDPEAWEKFASWVKDHAEVKDCKTGFKFENYGSKIWLNLNNPQRADDIKFEYWCRNYTISLTNIKVKKESNRYWIVDWDVPVEDKK